MLKVRRSRGSRVRQGDVLRDVEYIEYATEKSGVLEVSKIVFPLVLVLSQDCDLEQDYRFRWGKSKGTTHDKWLISVLVAPLYNADHVFQGSQLSELGMTMAAVNRKKSPGRFLMNNETPRFHYLEFPEETGIVPSVIDFKHYFAANVSYLKQLNRKNFVCSISPVFREDVSQRFASFLARVGLPVS
jgi:hypothetical protein